MFLVNLAVICKLYSLRKSNVIGRQSPVAVFSATTGEEGVEEQVINTRGWKVRKGLFCFTSHEFLAYPLARSPSGLRFPLAQWMLLPLNSSL